MKAADWQRFGASLERVRDRLLETGELDVTEESNDAKPG